MRSTTFNRAALAALALAASLLFVACGGGSDGEDNADGGTETSAPASGGGDGKALYAKSCASCHGPDAKGLPKLGKDLTTSEFTKGMTDAEVVAFVKVGRSASDPANTTGVDMPAKGGNPALTDDDLTAIVEYLRTLEE